MGSELNCTLGKQGGARGGDESEGTLLNILNKGLFRYTGLQYILSLVDYDTFCEHSSRERERHLLSNHADIEATKNNAIEHFLYVESFCDEQKICLNLVRRGHDVFAILPTGSGRETLIFLTLSTKNERTERKSWRVNFFCLFLFVLFCFFFSIQFNSLFHTI